MFDWSTKLDLPVSFPVAEEPMLFLTLFDTKTCFGDPPSFRVAPDGGGFYLLVTRIELLADVFKFMEPCFGVVSLFATLALGLVDVADFGERAEEAFLLEETPIVCFSPCLLATGFAPFIVALLGVAVLSYFF